MFSKIRMIFFTEIEKAVLKIQLKHQAVARAIQNRKNVAGDITNSDFKLFQRAMLIKLACQRHENQTFRPVNRIK